MKHKLIIDTDPGIDDAIALTFMLNRKDLFDIKLITSVSGNLPIDITTRNCLHLLEKFGREDIPVAVGASAPMKKKAIFAPDAHGVSGLGEYLLKSEPSLKPIPLNAVEALKKVIEEHAGEIEIFAIGPLTNIGMLLKKYPEVKSKIKTLYLMTSSIWGRGNISPTGEFNAFVDPDALKIVLTAGIPTVVSPIEMGLHLIFPPKYVEKLRKVNDIGSFFGKMLDGYMDPLVGELSAQNHDPALAYFLMHPELFIQKKMSVKFGKESGQTFFTDCKDSPITVLVTADKTGYEEAFMTETKKLTLK